MPRHCRNCANEIDEFAASLRFTRGGLCRHCADAAYGKVRRAINQPSNGESIVGAGDEDDDEETPQDFSRTPWLLYILAAIFGVVMIGCALRLVGVL